MFDVTALGEVLIDFTECGHNPDTGMALFERNPGGAPANVAAAVSRLAGRAAFIGKVGDDAFGAFLKKTMEYARRISQEDPRRDWCGYERCERGCRRIHHAGICIARAVG